MDGDERYRKQYGSSGYQTPSSLGTSSTQQMSFSSTEHFRQSSQAATRGEAANPTMSRSSNMPGFGGYGYPDQQAYAAQALQGGSLQGANIQYPTEYAQDTSRQQPTQQQSPQQQFPQYGSNVMYNIAPSVPPQSPYDAVPQFQQRQSAAIEVLSGQFGVQQYFPQGEPTTASMSGVQNPYITSQAETASYTQPSPATRPSVAQSYSSGMADYSSETLDQQQPAPASDNLDDAYNQYQQQVKMTFEATSAGRLLEASENLLNLSRWLLSRTVKLGLIHDEPELHSDRLQLWNDFNTCWLAVGQKQLDLVQDMLQTGRPPPNLLPPETIQSMADELVRMCDQIDQHGLVDYDMGVWEEEIIDVFRQCLDLLKPEVMPTSSSKAGASARPS